MDAHHHGNLPGLATPELAHLPVVDLATLGAATAPPACLNPTSDNAPWQARVEESEKTDNRDFASDNSHWQALAMMKARATQCKCTLRQIGGK